MNQNNENNRNREEGGNKKIELDGFYRTAAVLLALAIVSACFAYTKLDPLSPIQITVYVLALLLAFVALTIFSTARKLKTIFAGRNYFLYDRKTKREISPENLTFSHIRERVQKYMAMFRRGGKLYVGDLFDDSIGIPKAYRTLFCFELIYELGENAAAEKHDSVRLFLSFGEECADALSNHLYAAGERELAEKIRYFFSEYSSGNTDLGKFEQFLIGIRPHIEKVTVKYTTEHINEF